MTLSQLDIRYVRDLVKSGSGNLIGNAKAYLIESRLLPLAREHGLDSVSALLRAVRASTHAHLRPQVVEALATHETSFFRERSAFNALRDTLLPELLGRLPGQTITIWSAACSTGQEPYSIAMLVADSFPADANRVKIVASDFASAPLEQAKRGEYSQREINRGLPATGLLKHFAKSGLTWRVNAELRTMIRFQRINLARDPFPRCHIAFVRNVLIYFDGPQAAQVLGRVKRSLTPPGFLVLGGQESSYGMDGDLTPIDAGRSTVYRFARARRMGDGRRRG